MEISKSLQEEILAVQNKLKIAIRDHQIWVGKLKDDPNNTDIHAQIQKIHVHIVSLGRCQKQVVQRLRKEVETFKAENVNGAKVSIASLLGLNNNNHITSNNETKLKPTANECDSKPSKEHYEEDIVRNGDVRSPPRQQTNHTSNPSKGRSSSVETISGEDDVIEVSMDENSNEKTEEPPKERKDESQEKLNFLFALGLITNSRYTELQNKRAERKRRSTANPQFVYASLEGPTKRKRHSYLQSSGNAPQTRQTTARMNGPSPPPAKPAPAKSTSPPTRNVIKSLIPVQKSTTRPNILRNVSESKVYANKTKVENGPNHQIQLPVTTTKTVQSVGSKAVHIPGLPSSLTIERIENDSTVCINCRNPGTLTVCENCSSNYHVSCHTISPPPPRICPKCALLVNEEDGGEIGDEEDQDGCQLKKDEEIAATSHAPGVIRKTRENAEIYKTTGGFHKIDAAQNSRGFPSGFGINQLPSSTFLIPISSNNVSTTNAVVSETETSINSNSTGGAGNNEQRGSGVSYPPIVLNSLPQPSITYLQAEPQVSYNYQLPISSTQSDKQQHQQQQQQSYFIVQQITDSSRMGSQVIESQSSGGMSSYKRSGTTHRNLPIQPKISVANSTVFLGKQLCDSISRNRKKPTNRAIPALNRIVSTENISITTEYDLEQSPYNGRRLRPKPPRTKFGLTQLRPATEILLPPYDPANPTDGQLQIAKSTDKEETGLLGGHSKHKLRPSGILHSLFTSNNKSYIITDSNREYRTIDTVGTENSSALRKQLYHQDHQLESDQSNDSPAQLHRGALTKFFEHVKLEEAHISAPPRAKLAYKDITAEGDELGESRAEDEHVGDYATVIKCHTTTCIVSDGERDTKHSTKFTPARILRKKCQKSTDSSAKNAEARDCIETPAARIGDFVTYEHKHGNTYVTIECDPPKAKDTTLLGETVKPEISVLRCSEPEIWSDEPGPVSLYNAQSNLLELRNGVSVPDDKADTERQDLPSGRCSSSISNSSSGSSQSDTPEQAMHASIDNPQLVACENTFQERVGIGAVSPESMQVLEQFESAMLEVDRSNAATC